ncbi:DUF6116 family protein [Pseudohalioglobus lutimaris]|uniref:DUF6116 family protein n=1 Tax=Pseudohalioglobus lutimaris TaxID=1737061 RepID=UPI001A9EB908|nr:DUF6116 family protein [Pseudohalioglobus lutimaris]
MAAGKLARGGVIGVVAKWASRLRFPYLLLITGLLFVVNLFIPDVVPFADEIIMGLVTVFLANLKKKPQDSAAEGKNKEAWKNRQR